MNKMDSQFSPDELQVIYTALQNLIEQIKVMQSDDDPDSQVDGGYLLTLRMARSARKKVVLLLGSLPEQK